jgi:hypothetical protein
MSDLKKYIENRKMNDPAFAENYESGYNDFKSNVLLRLAHEASSGGGSASITDHVKPRSDGGKCPKW